MTQFIPDEETLKNQLRGVKTAMNVTIDNSLENLGKKKLKNLKKEFYSKYYFDTGCEDDLKEIINTLNKKLLIVAGEKGVGKTTTITKVLDELSFKDEHKYLRIDFEREYEAIKNHVSEFDFFRKITARINTILKNEFYDVHESSDTPDTEEDHLEELILELLSPRPADYIYRDVYEEYHSERTDVRALWKQTDKSIPFKDWIRTGNNGGPFKGFYDIYYPKMKNRLGIKELIWGLIKFNRCKKFRLFFDNVDKVGNNLQPFLLSIVDDLQNDFSTFAKCIVAIREINIQRPKGEATGDQSSVVDIYYFNFEVNRKKSLKNVYVSNFVHLDEKDSMKMVEKRLKFVREVEFQVKKKQLECSEDYKNLTTDKERKKWMDELEDEIKKEWSYVMKINKFITQTYIDEKLPSLANFSLRQILDVYSNFLEYISKLIRHQHQHKIEEFFELPKNKRIYYMVSVFYDWLVHHGPDSDIKIYDIVELYIEWEKSNKNKLGCLMDHIILTRLQNIREESRFKSGKRKYYHTKVEEIHNDLSALKVSQTEVNKTVYDLCFTSVMNNLIDIRIANRMDVPADHTKIIGDDEIWITERGRICCTDTIYKFTYLLSTIDKHDGVSTSFLYEPTIEDIKKVTDFLWKLSYMNLHGLNSIKERTYGDLKDDWLDAYRNKYCYKDELQLNHIISHHKKHLSHYVSENKLKEYGKIENYYSQEIEKIKMSKGTKVKILPPIITSQAVIGDDTYQESESLKLKGQIDD